MGTTANLSRRNVLVMAGAFAGAATLAGPFGPSASGAGRAAPLAASRSTATTGLQRSHWTGLVGRRVVVDGPAGRARARVAGVEDLRGAPPGDAGRFAVELRTDRAEADIAGLRPITIPGRGVATLLVSAVDRGARHRSFQIIVNNVS